MSDQPQRRNASNITSDGIVWETQNQRFVESLVSVRSVFRLPVDLCDWVATHHRRFMTDSVCRLNDDTTLTAQKTLCNTYQQAVDVLNEIIDCDTPLYAVYYEQLRLRGSGYSGQLLTTYIIMYGTTTTS